MLVLGMVIGGAGCTSRTQPRLNVLSVAHTPDPGRDMVVYVEVVNHLRRPMRLERLQYTFAAAGATTARGEIGLNRRLVDAGAAVVVEVPLLVSEPWTPGEPLTLAGRLYASQDEIVRDFAVSAVVAAPGERTADAP